MLQPSSISEGHNPLKSQINSPKRLRGITRNNLQVTPGQMRLETRGINYVEKQHVTCSSQQTLANCVSADFKMSAGNGRSSKRKYYPTKYPRSLKYYDVPLWTQTIPDPERFIYYQVTNERFDNKLPYSALSAPLERMREHAEVHGVKHLSLPQIACGLDNLEWPLVREGLQAIFDSPKVRHSVYQQTPRT